MVSLLFRGLLFFPPPISLSHPRYRLPPFLIELLGFLYLQQSTSVPLEIAWNRGPTLHTIQAFYPHITKSLPSLPFDLLSPFLPNRTSRKL